MLENEKFVEWANENVIVVVGHTETEHPTEVEDEKGKKSPGCPMYLGLTCEQHRAITGECLNPGEGLPKIEVGNGMPNSWLVGPDGVVEAIAPVEQQVSGKIQELIEAIQKKAGKVVPFKKYETVLKGFDDGDKAIEAGDLKAALVAYGKVAKEAAKMGETVNQRLDKKLDLVNVKAEEAYLVVKESDKDATAKWKAMTELRAKVAAKVGTKSLPVLAEIDQWIKDNKVPAKG